MEYGCIDTIFITCINKNGRPHQIHEIRIVRTRRFDALDDARPKILVEKVSFLAERLFLVLFGVLCFRDDVKLRKTA